MVFSLIFPRFVVSIATITVVMFRGTYFVDITTNFLSRGYRDKNWSPHVFYTVALKLIFLIHFLLFLTLSTKHSSL